MMSPDPFLKVIEKHENKPLTSTAKIIILNASMAIIKG